jgi:hypothetical protein
VVLVLENDHAIAQPEAVGLRLEAYAQACLTFSSEHFAYLSLALGNATIAQSGSWPAGVTLGGH